MKRDANALLSRRHDVLVIGGGIQGAAIAWECATRGLTVALVERDDFGGQTSANSLKTIHGGIRYLQHGRLGRVRMSAREQAALVQIAPHLVHPLPTLIPTYRRLTESRFAMRSAMLAYDALVSSTRRVLPKDHQLSRGRMVDAEECYLYAPGIRRNGLTGGAVYFDAQVYNSERLTLEFILSAVTRGASVLNYTSVDNLLVGDGVVYGARVRDRLTDQTLDVNSRVVITAMGPWTDQLIQPQARQAPRSGGTLAFNLVINRELTKVAVGIRSRPVGDSTFRQGRLLFVAPWRSHTLAGTAYKPLSCDQIEAEPTRDDIDNFLTELNWAWPGARLQPGDVSLVQSGVLPSLPSDLDESVRLATRPRILDHEKDGLAGCFSVVGVKYTTARAVAEDVVSRAAKAHGMAADSSSTRQMKLAGGDFQELSRLRSRALDVVDSRLDAVELESAIRNYGSRFFEVWRRLQPGEFDRVAWLDAMVDHSIDEEMAVHLEDVILRRTDLGSAGHPGQATLQRVASRMASRLSWTPEQAQHEIDVVEARYPLWTREKDRTPCPGAN